MVNLAFSFFRHWTQRDDLWIFVSWSVTPSITVSPSLSLLRWLSLSFSLSRPLWFPSLTVIPHLWPASDVYPRQMGHGKMAAVALVTEWRAGGENERFSFSFFFLLGCSGYRGDTENMWRGQQGHTKRDCRCLFLYSFTLDISTKSSVWSF